MKNKKILVYGSLRNNEYNFQRFKDYFPDGIEFVKTTTVKGFDLHSMGSYPGIKESKDENKELVVDVMHCTNQCFHAINSMELGAGYTTKDVEVDGEPHTIYVYKGNLNNPVISGDWSKFLKDGRKNV